MSVKNVKDNEVKMFYKSVFTGCSTLSIAFFGGDIFFQNMFLGFVIIIAYLFIAPNQCLQVILDEIDSVMLLKVRKS